MWNIRAEGTWRNLRSSLWVKGSEGEALSLVTLWRELHAFTIHSLFIDMVVGRKCLPWTQMSPSRQF